MFLNDIDSQVKVEKEEKVEREEKLPPQRNLLNLVLPRQVSR